MASMNQQTEKRLFLTDTLPEFATELRQLLEAQGEPELAAQVPGLAILERAAARTTSVPRSIRNRSRRAASVEVIGMWH
jgi:hypothetical protein